MWNLYKEVKSDSLATYNKGYGDGAAQTIFFDTYIKKLLKNLYAEKIESGALKFPMEIKVAPSPFEMSQGNFEPTQIIKIEKPLIFQDTPIWFNNSSKGVNLRLGNIEGDSRRPSPYVLDDKFIHGILAGKTGFGKSVTLNAIICSMAFEYAPWEIDITLLDGKAADLKRFGSTKLPHVSSVAATKDSAYIVSVLEDKVKEMNIMQAAINNRGVNKLEDLRKITGLTIPQHVIIIDEFQTIFTNAGKNTKHITSLIDDISRLGRSAGYHLYLASQGISSDISGDTMNQIPIRCCLGAAENVSTQILGNNAAASVRQKGNLIVNLSPAEGKKSDNVLLRVPFQPGPENGDMDQFTPQVNYLYNLGGKCNYIRPLNFYNETELMYEDMYPKYLAQFKHHEDNFYLGEPGFIMHDDEYSVKLHFDGSDIENILVFCIKQLDVTRHLKMLKMNAMQNSHAKQIVLCGDDQIAKSVGFKESGFNVYKIGNASADEITMVFRTVIGRDIMLNTDSKVSALQKHSDKADKILKELFGEDSEFYTDLNRSRVHYMCNIIPAEYGKYLGIGNMTGSKEIEDIRNGMLKFCFRQYKDMNRLNRLVTREDFGKTFIWLLGLDKIVGYGRVPNTSMDTLLRDILLMATNVNVTFILNIKDMSDMSSFVQGCRWVILDQPTTKMTQKIGGADYVPETCTNYLSMCVDRINRQVFKFKKICFRGEVII